MGFARARQAINQYKAMLLARVIEGFTNLLAEIGENNFLPVPLNPSRLELPKRLNQRREVPRAALLKPKGWIEAKLGEIVWQRRSEERRVGKECRGPGSPYH